MKYFFSREDAEVVRIEGEAPRTLYPCVEPRTTGTHHFSMGLQQVDPHSEIPLHSHDDFEEILFVFGGRATATVGDETAEIVPGSVVFIPPRTNHGFVNDHDEPLWITWTFSPQGFEGYIRGVAEGTVQLKTV
ncbi:MAG: cupin domain-containing protein [Deltaproteobacteria bacterium]|nr:cupin domain-containing protein [Deltaproteobacteria bacterium]MDE0341673.1 cupin domain-containing protein [Deltaproteobacteria bacterium]